ncbi:MAG: hypothetical protein M3328_14510, partial [Chloroflexota bacterium]|nr:hypothetical protein [Chloroflexota bacterium]
ALARRSQLQAKGGLDNMAAAAAVQIPSITIAEREVFVEAIDKSSGIGSGEYLNAVTLGSFKAIKVDASYGAVHAGDLLVSSPHAGYAMKADPAQAGVGTVIGKALGSLDSGTSTLPVMVSLR